MKKFEKNPKVNFWVSQLNTNVNPKYPRFILLKRGRVQQFVMTLQEGLIREKKCEMSSFKSEAHTGQFKVLWQERL